MVLRDLELENFGLYAGAHRFQLCPDPASSKPVILIGGQNGAGKTTFLEAVRLCLYGRLALGAVSRRGYEEHLVRRIHRPATGDDGPEYASLALAFDCATQGVSRRYNVTRSWSRFGGGQAVREELRVTVDGVELDDAEGRWSELVEDLVPIGVSQLFFFDGEKIKELASDDKGMQGLESAMKSMLGLDLIERLRADLDLYRRRKLKAGAETGLAEELEGAEATLKAAEEAVAALVGERKALEVAIGQTQARLALAERDLRAKGGAYAAAREENLATRERAEAKLDQQTAEARRLVEGLLPFACCPGIGARLVGRLAEDAKTREGAALLAHLRELEADLKARLKPAAGAVVAEVFDDYAIAQCQGDGELVHDVGTAAAERLRSQLAGAKDASLQADELVRAIAQTELEIRDAQRDLSLTPKEDALTGPMEQLRRVTQDLAELRQESALLGEREADAQRTEQKARRDMEKAEARLSEKGAADDRLALALRCKEALVVYQERLTRRKVEQLEGNIARRFAQLARKDDLVKSVRVDPETFDISLVGSGGRELSRTELSAGEKQVYAVATLWGLADTSGRPLPTVIDTPLGRLDTVHRSKFVHTYLPSVSHQVIVLSTDTEVDEQLYGELEPYVSRAFLLEADGGKTRMSQGYFWKAAAS